MGFLEHVGIRVDEGETRSTTNETATNASGGVHGGLLATMLDSAMGSAVRAELGEDAKTVTVQLSVTYLNGAKPGDELVASAEVLKPSTNLALVTGLVTRPSDGERIAQGQATFAILDKD